MRILMALVMVCLLLSVVSCVIGKENPQRTAAAAAGEWNEQRRYFSNRNRLLVW